MVGDKVTFEDNGTDSVYYTYDPNGQLVSMNLNGTEYFFVRNAQSDIIGLVDKTGVTVASYVYDTWGKLVSIKDGNDNDVTNVTTSVGYKNPYRYRGYRYDTESGLYYCNSRYYNPDWGRFLNADVVAGKVGALLSHNMFAYCGNNPVSRVDPYGNDWWDYVKAGLIGVSQAVLDAGLILTDNPKGEADFALKLGEASEVAYKAADNIGDFVVSNKHLLDAGGRFAKFATNSKEQINVWIEKALRSDTAQFLPNNVEGSYKIIADLGEQIGSKPSGKMSIWKK